MILGRLIFAIQWGSLLPSALVTFGTVLAAATFGIFIMSLLKSTKPGWHRLGGVLTVTGMLGMVKIFHHGLSHHSRLGRPGLHVRAARLGRARS